MEGNTIKVKEGEKESNKCNGCGLRIKEPKTKKKEGFDICFADGSIFSAKGIKDVAEELGGGRKRGGTGSKMAGRDENGRG